jgi:hypothetical protein
VSLNLGFPFACSLMSRSISQALSNDILQREVGAGCVIDSERKGAAIAEFKFRQMRCRCFSAQCWYTPFIPGVRAIERSDYHQSATCRLP